MTLRNIVFISFNVRSDQVAAPDWMNERRFDITAKVPDGATREQLYPMLQNMLIERFGLKFHTEEKEVRGYLLVVAKNGPKFKEAAPEPPKDPSIPAAPAPSPAELTLAPDGFPAVTPGVNGVWRMAGHSRGQWVRAPVQRLVLDLNRYVDGPVTDGTGLNGRYDLGLYWVSSDLMGHGDNAAEGPSIFEALQSQLGLRLEARRTTIPIIVIDHAERAPTDD